jgi:hypothetical protein
MSEATQTIAICEGLDVYDAAHYFERISKTRLAGRMAVKEACLVCGVENEFLLEVAGDNEA